MATKDPKTVGHVIGLAIALDARAEGMPREWTGLDPQDADVAMGFGITPDSPEWEEMERTAKSEFESQMSLPQPRSNQWAK